MKSKHKVVAEELKKLAKKIEAGKYGDDNTWNPRRFIKVTTIAGEEPIVAFDGGLVMYAADRTPEAEKKTKERKLEWYKHWRRIAEKREEQLLKVSKELDMLSASTPEYIKKALEEFNPNPDWLKKLIDDKAYDERLIVDGYSFHTELTDLIEKYMQLSGAFLSLKAEIARRDKAEKSPPTA